MSDRFEEIEFDVETGSYRAEYDPGRIAPSIAVVEIVRTVSDRAESDGESLYDVVDPEALDRVLENTPHRDHHGTRTVTFSFRETTVTATSDGQITVRPCSDGEPSAEVSGGDCTRDR